MQWQYKTLKIKDASWFTTKLDEESVDRQLDALGEDGWELVSSFAATQNGSSMFYVFLFKRPATAGNSSPR